MEQDSSVDRAETSRDCKALCTVQKGGKSGKTEWVAFICNEDDELTFPTKLILLSSSWMANSQMKGYFRRDITSEESCFHLQCL
jgi:hypothetical protein